MPSGRVISGIFLQTENIFKKETFGGKSDLKTPKVMEDASVERDRENKAGSFSVLLSSTVTAQ